MAWLAEAQAVESSLRHHDSNERDFGFPPKSLLLSPGSLADLGGLVSIVWMKCYPLRYRE